MTPRASFKLLRTAALAYPEAYEEKPWGHEAFKVRNKSFAFMSLREGRFALTTKLPETGVMATSLEFAEPSGYGLGKSGWVTAVFDGNDVPGELLVEWLDESYRAVAPKRLVKQLDCDAALRAQKTKKLAKKTTRKKTTRKKTKKLKGKVLLVGFEELRLSRAADALVDAGCRAVTTRSPDGLANLKRRLFELLVVDVGRRPVSTLDAALERMELDPRAQAVFAGVRDAVFQRRVETEAPRKVACHRGPPGDPRVVAALLEHLR